MIVVFAFYVVGWAVWEPLQWVALLLFSVVTTFALYEGVRRWSVTRFLFGMRPKTRSAGEAKTTGPRAGRSGEDDARRALTRASSWRPDRRHADRAWATALGGGSRTAGS